MSDGRDPKDSDGKDEESPLDKTSVVPSETFRMRVAQAGQAPPAVVLLVGPTASVGKQWQLEHHDVIVGRSETSQIHVYDQSISKSHAKFVVQAGEVSVIDLQSTNKTIVNGKIIPPLVPHKLQNNDQIKTGNVIFKFLSRGNIESVSVAETFERGQTDALTGIYNRGALNVEGAAAFKKSELLDIPYCLLSFDIDHFKKVNDTYGHPAGDYVLQEISKIVREKLIRENDFFARYGGEEFCIVLLGSPVSHASEVAERIRNTIAGHNFEFQGKKIPVTLSLGLASRKSEDADWTETFERADQALYKSKNAGRNRLTIAD